MMATIYLFENNISDVIKRFLIVYQFIYFFGLFYRSYFSPFLSFSLMIIVLKSITAFY